MIEIGTRIRHTSDEAKGTVEAVATDGCLTMVLVAWDDGEHDSYDAANLYQLQRNGRWYVY